jgi:hypothetical protein
MSAKINASLETLFNLNRLQIKKILLIMMLVKNNVIDHNTMKIFKI